MRKRSFCLPVFILAFVLLSFPAVSKQELKISLKGTEIKDFDSAGLSLVFYITVANPSRSHYFLAGYDYRFMVSQKEYLRLTTSLEEPIRIEPKKETLVSFPLMITYAHLFQAVEGIEKEDKAQSYLTGTVVFSDGKREKERLPFAFSAEFPLFKKPEVKFLSLKIKELTIGGADVAVEVSLINSNPYELLVDRIGFAFYIGESPISEGIISGDKNIGSRGEKVFSLPFLFNFFDVGQNVHDLLRQTSALCRLAGEIEVKTVWGRVKVSFDKAEKVPIVRTP